MRSKKKKVRSKNGASVSLVPETTSKHKHFTRSTALLWSVVIMVLRSIETAAEQPKTCIPEQSAGTRTTFEMAQAFCLCQSGGCTEAQAGRLRYLNQTSSFSLLPFHLNK